MVWYRHPILQGSRVPCHFTPWKVSPQLGNVVKAFGLAREVGVVRGKGLVRAKSYTGGK